jgi:hypothetical protein
MEINNTELIELIQDEPNINYAYNPFELSAKRVGEKQYSKIVILDSNGNLVVMQWQGGQEYLISQSNHNELYEGHTTSVNEILDILL